MKIINFNIRQKTAKKADEIYKREKEMNGCKFHWDLKINSQITTQLRWNSLHANAADVMINMKH